MKKVTIYTDGACSGNPGPGGWGAVLVYGEVQKELSGYAKFTTNNQMELLSAVKALEALKEPCEVSLYSDSAYLCRGFNDGWITTWMKNGWKNFKGDEVKNRPLWEKLIALSKVHRIAWIKVKGHSGNPLNEQCDRLARGQIKSHVG